MTGKKLQRLLACLLAVLLLSQVGAFLPAARAADGYSLQNGTAIIKSTMTTDEVNHALTRALVKDFDQLSEDTQAKLLDDLKWEYKCEGKDNKAGILPNTAWGSIGGFTSETGKYIKTTYTHPALAKNDDGNYQVRVAGTTAEVTLTKAEKLSSSIALKEGVSVKLPYNEDGTLNADALRAAIFAEVVENTTPELKVSDVTIEYYATAESGSFVGVGKAWMPLEGGTKDLLTYPAISAGEQKIRISYAESDTYFSTSPEATVTFTERADSHIVLKSGQQVALPYVDATTVDYDALRAAILATVVDETTTPALTTENTEIKYYASSALVDHKEWVKLEGEYKTIPVINKEIGYPAIPAGDQQIQISFKGDGAYKASSETITVTFAERPGIKAVTKENPTFKLDFTADGEAIYNNIKQQVFGAVVESTNPTLTVDDVTIEYYATATTGSLDKIGHAWVALTGGKVNGLTYPAIGEGTQQVRITWGGSKDYAAWQWQGNVAVTGRADAPFRLKEGVTEGMTVAMVYNRDQSINYAETAQALRDALLESTDPNISIDDVTVQYNAGTDVIKNYQPLNYSPTGSAILDNLIKFGLGSQTIHFVWNGNADYKPLKLDDVKVEMTDSREISKVVLKPSISIVYNMDASVMEQNIFEYVIDWDDSKLPDKSTLSADDFTIEYYGENVLGEEEGGISGGVKQWAPVAGGKVNLLNYPQMGAGEQQIRVTYKGNADYRPSDAAEANLTVKKAKVSVKVHSTSIYADEELSKDFITTDPADKFDIYTIYGGVTSDVTTSVFVQLPERLTKGAIIELIDKTLKDLGHKTLTQMMQEGTTVGELRKLLSDIVAKGDDLPQFVKDLLQKVGIDIDTLVKLNEALNKFPGLLDNVRVAFGTPDQAGIYTVYAITNNKNYETGFGMGALVVKKHYSGVKLQWNKTIPNGKISAADAKDFDFGVTLMYNGEPAAKQTNVHYLYSGFTSKWKPYSSTTTPPTEPGRYVMTVVTLGGNYQAAPITRSFQITK